MNQSPDILLIISDDHRWCDSGAYGNGDVHTPHLDRLAAEGMRFDNYYTPSPICAPGRMALYTGLFPVRNGGWPNHSQCYDGTRSIVHHLGALGYRVGLHGKSHVGPESVFPFEQVDDIPGFVGRAPTQPYCLIIGTREPHTPWGAVDDRFYDPQRIELAPNLGDTPGTRRALARYYSDLTRLDAKIGEILAYVDASAHAENTIVIYTSDHGAQFPGGKWTCYEPGLRVPFVVRWPQRIATGTSSSALVQHVDVLPTLIEAAGGDPTGIDTGREGAADGGRGFDGASFLEVLLGNAAVHRDVAYGVHTQHGTINGAPYPVRSVRDDRYKYIVNPCHASEYSNALTGKPNPTHENLYWQEWLDYANTDARASFLVERYLRRPAEELYDLKRDPWELDNRISDPSQTGVRDHLAGKLAGWMEQQGDEDRETELLALTRQAARKR